MTSETDVQYPPSVHQWVASWWFLGLASIAVVLLVPEVALPSLDVEGGFVAVAIAVAVTAVSEYGWLSISHGQGDSRETVTLIETTLVAVLIVFPLQWAFWIALAGVAIGQALRRSGWFRYVFNLAQYAVSLLLAVGALAVLRGGADASSWRGLLAAAASTLVFGIVNWLAVSGVVARIEGRSTVVIFREGDQIAGLVPFGNMAVGIIAAILYLQQPSLLLLAVVPAVTLRTAYRGLQRSRELRRELEAERDLLDRLVSGATDGVALVDGRGRVHVWSPRMAEITGVSEDEAIGVPLDECLTATGEDGHEVDLIGVLIEATPDTPTVQLDVLVRRGDGSDRVVQISGAGQFDRFGRLDAHVLLARDVTRERETERLKDDFLMRVTHELRTPLTPIKGFAQSLLAHKDRVTPQILETALNRISDRTDHMVRLIDDLLLVSSMSSRSLPTTNATPIAFPVVSRCRRIVRNLEGEEPDRTFVLAGDEAEQIEADPAWFDQILMALVSNACTYSEPDQPVRIEIRAGEETVEVAVIDQGRGVAADQMERIFDRFHRVEDPLLMTTSGLGIGLYIARRLSNAMGGSLEADSTLGEGSTFTLTLPRGPRREDLGAAAGGRAVSDSAASTERG